MKTIKMTEEQLEMMKSALLCLYQQKSQEATKVYDLYESLASSKGETKEAEEEQR